MRKFSLLLAFFTVACVPNYDPGLPLNQQLSGRLPQEQQEILRLDCLNQAERITPFIIVHQRHGSDLYQASPPMTAVKKMCDEMDSLSADDQGKAHILADECGKRLTEISAHSAFKTKPTDIKKMQQLCTVMTKQPIIISP